MRRTLFGDVEALRAIVVVVPAAKEFAEDGVVRLLDAPGLDVPSGEVVLEHAQKTFLRIIALLCAADDDETCELVEAEWVAAAEIVDEAELVAKIEPFDVSE